MGNTRIPPPPTLDPSVRLGAGLGTPPPYFEVEKHKKMGFGLGRDSGRAVDMVFVLKIGYNITDDIILPKLLKLATLPLKIAPIAPNTPNNSLRDMKMDKGMLHYHVIGCI